MPREQSRHPRYCIRRQAVAAVDFAFRARMRRCLLNPRKHRTAHPTNAIVSAPESALPRSHESGHAQARRSSGWSCPVAAVTRRRARWRLRHGWSSPSRWSAKRRNSPVWEPRSSELPGSRQRPPVVRHTQFAVPVPLDLAMGVTVAITRLGQSRVDADYCCSADAGGSRTTMLIPAERLWLSARPHRVAPLARAGFRIAGRMQRCRVSGTGRCV
jgi:hypothetical protein